MIDSADNIDIEGVESENNEAETSINDESSVHTESLGEKTKLVKFPLARVKHLMKMDPDCELLSQESILLVTKSAELFLAYLAKETVKFTNSSKRKTVQKKDVDAAIDSVPNLYFLDGALNL